MADVLAIVHKERAAVLRVCGFQGLKCSAIVVTYACTLTLGVRLIH